MSTQTAHVRAAALPSRATVAAWGQVAVGLASWLAFGAGWVRVVTRGLAPAGVLRDVVLLAGLLAVIAVVTTWWVRHNRAIYRRKGPRRAAPAGPGYPALDRLGRRMVADVEAARRSADIVVVVADRQKTFRC